MKVMAIKYIFIFSSLMAVVAQGEDLKKLMKNLKFGKFFFFINIRYPLESFSVILYTILNVTMMKMFSMVQLKKQPNDALVVDNISAFFNNRYPWTMVIHFNNQVKT